MNNTLNTMVERINVSTLTYYTHKILSIIKTNNMVKIITAIVLITFIVIAVNVLTKQYEKENE
jgi:Na+-transporting NADH:ubiquinone oxidoreductase subunit NqrD